MCRSATAGRCAEAQQQAGALNRVTAAHDRHETYTRRRPTYGRLFVGHALLGFALAVLFAEWRGWSAEQALALGVTTAAFAALPDVDVLYAVVAVDPGALLAGTGINPEEFWGTANEAHRLMTHSLVVAAIAGPAFGLWILGSDPDDVVGWPAGDRRRQAGIVIASVALAVLVAATWIVSGPIGGFVMTAFAGVGVGIAVVSHSYFALSPRVVGTAAVVGIASHPWGDMATGSPPALLYPFELGLLPERVVLHSDPTLHLLAAFGLELGVVTLAAAVYARHMRLDILGLVDRSAALGIAYGAVAVVMVPPTIDTSYHFVFSILAVGLACAGVQRSRGESITLGELPQQLFGTRTAALRTVCTMIAGVALALVSYTLVYLVVS